jgi:hypothetical protein
MRSPQVISPPSHFPRPISPRSLEKEVGGSGLENPNAENMGLDNSLLMRYAASLGHFPTGRRGMVTCRVVGLGGRVSRCTACGEVGFPTLGIVDAEGGPGVLCGDDTEVNGHL